MVVSGEIGEQDIEYVVVDGHMEHNNYTYYYHSALQSGSELKQNGA